MPTRRRHGNIGGNNVHLPITVRQAQKYVQKMVGTRYNLPAVLDSVLGHCTDVDGALRTLARLASKDPNQVLVDANGNSVFSDRPKNAEPNHAPKGTDETALQSDSPFEDSPLHGGSNTSQEVEDNHSQGGDNDLNNDFAQLQEAAGTDEGGYQGQSSGDAQDCQWNNIPDSSDRNAPQSSGCETGVTTSQECESGGKSQAPFSQQAGSSEFSGGSESGEGTATSSVTCDSEKNYQKANNNDSALRDEQVHQDSCFKQKTHLSVSAEAEDNVNSDRQAETEKQGSTEGRSQKDDSEQASDDSPTHQKKWGKSFSSAETGQGNLSLSANNNTGEVTASLKKANISPKLLKLCRDRLAKLVGDSSQEFGPRRDYQDFCVRLKTFRNPQPARKEEEGRPAILLLADVSPSCASFSRESVKVAKAASRLGVQGADVLVVTHFNGDPKEMEINGKSVSINSIKPSRNIKLVGGGSNHYRLKKNYCDWYDALLKQHQITVCIALGDWDASREYAYLAQHPQVDRVIWLDNAHCSSRGIVKDRTKFALEQYHNYTGIKLPLLRQKLIYKDGCKDAIAFINNIE